jgi:hypothetical protein
MKGMPWEPWAPKSPVKVSNADATSLCKLASAPESCGSLPSNSPKGMKTVVCLPSLVLMVETIPIRLRGPPCLSCCLPILAWAVWVGCGAWDWCRVPPFLSSSLFPLDPKYSLAKAG